MLVIRLLQLDLCLPLQPFRPLVLTLATLEEMICYEQAEYLVQGVRRVFELVTNRLFCMGVLHWSRERDSVFQSTDLPVQDTDIVSSLTSPSLLPYHYFVGNGVKR